jgi:glycosyltransferase involved in cell wall biosynthesis
VCRRRLALRLATHAVANSDASRADLVDVLGVPGRRVVRVYNSVEDPLRAFAAPPKDPARIVCVGAMLPAKGQEDLLRAAALIRDLDFSLELIGDGPTRPRLERAAAELGLAGRCTFAGARPNRDVLPRVAAAAVAVVPSLVEAFGLVNIEAMAVATPVVASRVGGIPEIIRDGVDGFLVPPGDPPAIAARLRQLLTDPALRHRVGAEARRAFLGRFERSRAVEAQADWLHQLAENPRAQCEPQGRGT